MTRGIYTAATGMLAEEAAQQVIAQNLANASTNGYKQQVPSFQSFGETLVSMVDDNGGSNVGTLGHGASVQGAYTDLSDGPLQQTGNNLDVALRGDAYLAVQTQAGTEYTRDGALTLNAQGTLVQANSGYPVLDGSGKTITLPTNGSALIGSTGAISVGNKPVADLGLYAIDQANQPTKLGENLISVAQAPRKIDPSSSATAYVADGFLEGSNVSVVKQMVTMIACSRSYEANAKAMQSQDSLQDKAISQVGIVG